MKKFFYILMVSLLAACAKDDDDLTDNCPPANAEESVMVVNEGQFLAGNAEIGRWALESNTYTPGIYESTNDELLGDILQSYYRTESAIYWVVNNSGKIVVTDMNLNKTGQIDGFGSPRYMTQTDNGKAYVSDLFSSDVSVLDLNSNTISSSVTVSAASTDKIFSHTNNVITIGSTLVDSENWVYEYDLITINAETDQPSTIDLDFTVSDATQSVSGEIYLAGSAADFSPVIYSFNPETAALDELNWSVGNISKIDTDANGNLIIMGSEPDENDNSVVINRLYRYNLDTDETAVITDINVGYGYGLTVNKTNNEMYVLDAADFTNPGTAFRYNQAGTLLNTIGVGVVPNQIYIP